MTQKPPIPDLSEGSFNELRPLLIWVIKSHRDLLEKHDSRIRRIEAIMFLGLGASAAAGSIGGSVIGNLVGGG